MCHLKGAAHAHARQGMRRLSKNRHTVEQDFACIGQQLAIDQMKSGAFASAIGANQSQHFTGLHIERHIVDRLVTSKGFAQVLYL